jgi:hypothetical protein
LEADNLRQTNRVIELTNKLNATKTRNKERSDGEDKQRMDEIKFLAEQSEHLKNFLKKVNEK